MEIVSRGSREPCGSKYLAIAVQIIGEPVEARESLVDRSLQSL